MSQKIPMPPRRPEVVQAEYEKVCTILGEKRYQLAVIESAINQLMQQVDQLVGEAKRAAAVHSEKQPPAGPTLVEEPQRKPDPEEPKEEKVNDGESQS